MDVVASWTGERADALRQALRMTNESFAGHLGIAVRTVAYWRERPDVVPRPSMQEILDTSLAQASAAARIQFSLILADRDRDHTKPLHIAAPSDAARMTSWITATNASDEAIADI